MYPLVSLLPQLVNSVAFSLRRCQTEGVQHVLIQRQTLIPPFYIEDINKDQTKCIETAYVHKKYKCTHLK